MSKFFLTVVLAGLPLLTHAQSTLSGTIVDSKTLRTLEGATVQVQPGGRWTVTDVFGRFHITALLPGEYQVNVHHLGYTGWTQTVSIADHVTIEVNLEESATITDEIIVESTRASETSPTTYSEISAKAIRKQNFGQDLPFLLNWTPSVVTTSDAGTGIGYTGIRIRGSDASRVNVTINGIPYNDSESQGTFWVNISDIASSTQSVQIQRGVGTSTNGAGAFGASVNLQTTTLQSSAYAEVQASAGSFNTQRLTVKAGTGLLSNQWAFDGRVSTIASEGYVDRASADLNSYYFSGGYYGKKTILKGIVFGGHEVTYQAWYGVDEATLRQQRTFNYAGALYDANYNVTGYYKDEVDNYRQDHSQLHVTHQFNEHWNAHAALHYTYGRGYFEQYKQQQLFADLGLPDIVLGDTTLESSDVIVRRWLQNDFYGLTFATQYTHDKWNATLGGAVNTYTRAGHFGEIIWAQYAANSSKDQRYYNGESDKDDANVYLKSVYQFTDRISGYADFQYRWVTYRTQGVDDDQSAYHVSDRFGFFNPKFGLTYQVTATQQWYTSLAWANREPNRSDYLDNEVKPKAERLINGEAGWRKNSTAYALEVNYYFMHYKDQLVLTGEINNSGYPVRANIGTSYRTGLEAAGKWRLSDKFSVQATATVSQNKNVDFVQVDENNAVTTANTDIILSPRFTGAGQVSWFPIRNAEITWLSKYVGSQYQDNTQNSALRLSPYAVQDVRLVYSIPVAKTVADVSLLVNNVLDVTYESNGYVYEGTPYYFPQAGRHFLVMVAVRF